MKPRINVTLLPELSTPDQFDGATAVVIDVLRASTTIATALAAGATAVVPCLEVEEAVAIAGRTPQALLGGERGGRRIEGFDLGNSPDEYREQVVRGKTIIFTTTNGTRALRHCCQATRILIGSFVNLSAICDALQGVPRIELLCAGTNRAVTREDVLFAGAVVEQLGRAATAENQNDQAQIAVAAWRSAQADLASGTSLAETLRASQGGRNLIEIGQQTDIELAASIDRLDVLPVLDRQSAAIRCAE